MTTTLLPTISMSDAELVAASRNGNREAFGQIVRKYQSMISGLIYAACGDLHRSEDLAQETFISAWKSLSGLRDAARLPGWLCQIARRRIADHFREPATQKIRLQEQLAETIPAQPADPPMSAEESEMLWRTLSRIPQPYRETMVLYYRQGQSTAEVAAAMETTDAGVRQRLSRGRQMLRDELAAMVERNLAKSAPGAEFSLAVMAALPMAAAQATAITGAGAAKGSAAAKSSGLLFSLSNWLAPLLGLLTMGLITLESIRRADSAAAKKSIVAYWVVFWLVIATWIVACTKISGFGQARQWDYDTYIHVFSAIGSIFCITLFGLLAWASNQEMRDAQARRTSKMFRSFWPRFVFLTPLIYCGLGWLINFALHAHDHITAELIAAGIIGGCAICAWRNSTEAIEHNSLKMAFESWLLIVSITLLVLNLRLRLWIAATHHLTVSNVQQQVPLWSINIGGAIVIAWMVLLRVHGRNLTTN